jgi:hypothetical protein
MKGYSHMTPELDTIIATLEELLRALRAHAYYEEAAIVSSHLEQLRMPEPDTALEARAGGRAQNDQDIKKLMNTLSRSFLDDETGGTIRTLRRKQACNCR